MCFHDRLYECDRRLEHGMCQIETLLAKRDDFIKRYHNAVRNNCPTFRIRMRCRLLVLEGVIAAYVTFIEKKQNEMHELREAECAVDDVIHQLPDDLDLEPFDSQYWSDENEDELGDE
ncbi:hypothetical protein DPMN_082970 [Dreissena polymorpha]|uniref:Uncharacterized protein n=1 Tax=Dreissena polymorpha TaxID=45954 RepID=A0A9D3Y8G7_DREPO|nr:hypothetical protein DPMN_082970 [Dreissena polymorpha]